MISGWLYSSIHLFIFGCITITFYLLLVKMFGGRYVYSILFKSICIFYAILSFISILWIYSIYLFITSPDLFSIISVRSSSFIHLLLLEILDYNANDSVLVCNSSAVVLVIPPSSSSPTLRLQWTTLELVCNGDNKSTILSSSREYFSIFHLFLSNLSSSNSYLAILV